MLFKVRQKHPFIKVDSSCAVVLREQEAVSHQYLSYNKTVHLFIDLLILGTNTSLLFNEALLQM